MFAGNAAAFGLHSITLDPLSASNPVNTQHTVTATVTTAGIPPNAYVTFYIIDGPHKGLTYTVQADDNGIATFTYTGTNVGTDYIKADAKLSPESTTGVTSNTITKVWIPETVIPEFPTIALPMIAMLGLAFVFMRRTE